MSQDYNPQEWEHYNKLFIAGTKDKIDFVDDLKLPFDETLTKTNRGRDIDSYYRSHHEIDTVIGHSLGGSVALALEKKYKKEDGNPFCTYFGWFTSTYNNKIIIIHSMPETLHNNRNSKYK